MGLDQEHPQHYSMTVLPLPKPWGNFWKREQIAASFPVNTDVCGSGNLPSKHSLHQMDRSWSCCPWVP